MSDADYISFLEFLLDNGLGMTCRDVGVRRGIVGVGRAIRVDIRLEQLGVSDMHPMCNV
jgi:hypothetical protein